MGVTQALSAAEDAFGQQLLDWLDGRREQALLERDDGYVGPAMDVSYFFTEPAEWPEAELEVFAAVSGRVLDVGAGAGRHALAAQTRGYPVVAIDVSPGAVEVCRRRGVRDVRLLALDDNGPNLGVFDSVLMMCGNFGLVGDRKGAVETLSRLHRVTSERGRIVLDTVDPSVGIDDADRAYQASNRKRKRMPGQVTIRIRYRNLATPYYDLLNVSAAELGELAAETRWRMEMVRQDGPDVYAVLAKAG